MFPVIFENELDVLVLTQEILACSSSQPSFNLILAAPPPQLGLLASV